MKRREFIRLIGGAVAVWPLGAPAQQPSIPVVGFLGATTPEATAYYVEAFRRGLSETGFVDGHSVKIEYRWADTARSNCLRWRRISSAARWTSLWPAAIAFRRWRPKPRRRRSRSFFRLGPIR